MKIYINDIPVILDKDTYDPADYPKVLNALKDKVKPKKLIDDVLVQNATPVEVEHLLQLMTDNKFKNLDSVTFTSSNKRAMIEYIKRKFKVVEAAGGVVEKESKNLLIYRQGKWDLPKGKLDPGEKRRACARREVEEETGVKVEIVQKIGHTWHTYTRNRKYVLKKTHWYLMKSLDDSQMSPQEDEGIEEVRWMDLTEMRQALYGSYRSIRVVIHEYHKLLKANKPAYSS